MKKLGRCALRAAAWGVLALAAEAAGAATILDTKHNLSVSGPGTLKAVSETRVCVFCHTPHNAAARTPLWNREVAPRTYTLYASAPTLQASPGQPLGPSRLCLSCHDGTIALGAVLQPPGGIAMSSEILPGTPAAVGTGADLSREHPISFLYGDAAGTDPDIRPSPSGDLVLYGSGFVECPTCHDPHRDSFLSRDKRGALTGKFLVVDNRASGLCTRCHDPAAWIGSAHQQSTALVDASVFPVAPRSWPTWATVGEWGCGSCHAPHGSESGPMLLYRPSEAETCALCHGGLPSGDPHASALGAKSVRAQTEKISAHRMSRLPRPSAAQPAQWAGGEPGGVSCADCHNAHAMAGRAGAAQSAQSGRATGLAGSLRGVGGVDRTGAPVARADHEYEICFKCHGERPISPPFVQRAVATADTRLEFEPANASFHPVVAPGRSPIVPSLGTQLEPSLRPSSTIACSDCHSDDGGLSRGPHGSAYAPILRERYETADGTVESYQSYALCYRCHERASILADASFRSRAARGAAGGGHSGHLAAGASCAACHDPHGVPPSPGTGDHDHLINFDVAVVQALPGASAPLYRSRGPFSGACSLVCHGRVHDGETYP